jgi:hypothetical protein
LAGCPLLFLLGLDAVVDFFAMYRDVLGRIYPDTDLISLDSEDGDLNLIVTKGSVTTDNHSRLSPTL